MSVVKTPLRLCRLAFMLLGLIAGGETVSENAVDGADGSTLDGRWVIIFTCVAMYV